MKRLGLFVVALVFAFCTTVMAAEPVAAPTQEQAVAAEKADVKVDKAKAKADAKKAAKKAAAKKAKAAKKAAAKKAAAEKKAEEAAPADTK
jgi:colicin import membrane protein